MIKGLKVFGTSRHAPGRGMVTKPDELQRDANPKFAPLDSLRDAELCASAARVFVGFLIAGQNRFLCQHF